jgi:hypothetical protein
MAADKQHAHHLLEQLGPGQLAAVVQLLETMIPPGEDGDTLIRLRAQDHRIFFRDKGENLEISRVLDRKEAYR